MSTRNYHAFIRAARKTGGLSLPSARKVYHKVKERLGEQPKGKDVKLHPRIFRESLSKRDRDRLKRESTPVRSSKRGNVVATPKVVKGAKRGATVRGKPDRTARVGTNQARGLDDRAKQGLGLPNASEANHEYAASSDYKGLRVQVHVKSDRQRTHKELGAAVNAWMRREPLPEGVTVSAIEWANGRKDFEKETNPRRARLIAENFRKIGLDFN